MRSPELIEQRLENLKRRPTWRAYLDEYVKAHPDDDKDDDDDDDDTEDEDEREDTPNDASKGSAAAHGPPQSERSARVDHGFVKTTLWSITVVAMTPLWVVVAPFLLKRGADFWPLQCPSFFSLYRRCVAQLVFVGLALLVAYYSVCKEVPESNIRRASIVLHKELLEMLEAGRSCGAAVSRGNQRLVRELCSPVAVDVVFLQAAVALVFKTHRKWARVLLVMLALAQFTKAPERITAALQPVPEITAVDPAFALVDEEILIAIDGKNLQPGGTVAWASYWGCAVSAPVESCELQYPGVFDLGVVSVTFSSMDHFVPCYRNPPNPLKVEDFRCFPHLRLRVKDKHSMPGWSLAAGSDAAAQQAPQLAHDEPSPQTSSTHQTRHIQRVKVKTVHVGADSEVDVQ
ncbi:hypothetical protein PINS_up013444 [Pythium insidiosum]|nr:hypothetical protein PINS_up013444 [Pythium insidiosum]